MNEKLQDINLIVRLKQQKLEAAQTEYLNAKAEYEVIKRKIHVLRQTIMATEEDQRLQRLNLLISQSRVASSLQRIKNFEQNLAYKVKMDLQALEKLEVEKSKLSGKLELRRQIVGKLTNQCKHLIEYQQQLKLKKKRVQDNKVQSASEEEFVRRLVQNNVTGFQDTTMKVSENYSNHNSNKLSRSRHSERAENSQKPNHNDHDYEQQSRQFSQLMQRHSEQPEEHSGHGEDAQPQHSPLPHADIMQSNWLYKTTADIAASAMPSGMTDMDKLSALISQHVEAMAVTESSVMQPDDAQMMLKLNGALFDQTQFVLSRMPDGWLLKAAGHSRDQLNMLKSSSNRLVQRFGEAGLGRLIVETNEDRETSEDKEDYAYNR